LALRDGFKYITDNFKEFGNARGSRKIFEKAVKKQTVRLARCQEELTKDVLMLLSEKDIEKAINEYMEEINILSGYIG
jgi:hypothetical protein